MNIVLRALSVYIVLLVVLRVAGKRTISEITTFDFILLMILSEAIQQSLIGSDLSLSRGVLVVLTLVMAEVGLTLLKVRFPVLEKWLDGTPTVIVENGKLLKDRLTWVRVDEDDILSAAREKHGLERMDQIKFAVLEIEGGISIIPMPDAQK